MTSQNLPGLPWGVVGRLGMEEVHPLMNAAGHRLVTPGYTEALMGTLERIVAG